MQFASRSSAFSSRSLQTTGWVEKWSSTHRFRTGIQWKHQPRFNSRLCQGNRVMLCYTWIRNSHIVTKFCLCNKLGVHIWCRIYCCPAQGECNLMNLMSEWITTQQSVDSVACYIDLFNRSLHLTTGFFVCVSRKVQLRWGTRDPR